TDVTCGTAGPIPRVVPLTSTATRPMLQRVMNPLDPSRLSSDERLDQIAEILAAGFLRLRIRRQQSCYRPPENLASALDLSGRQSMHANISADGEERHAREG